VNEFVPLWQRGMSFVGLFAMIGIAWLFSTNRRQFPKRVVAWGVGLQLFFGLLVLRTSSGLWLFRVLNDGVVKLLEFTARGTEFVFGDYATEHFSFALNVLPTILFFSALMAVFYHLGVMQRVVGAVAWLMQRTMKTSGAESLSAAANIFVGQTEAPLVVRPYIARMTVSELNAVMVGGFATVAGGVLAAYVGMLHDHFPNIAGHLIAASVLSAPAALVIAKVMVPETGRSETAEGATAESLEKLDANLIDAVARGASDGLKLALNVGAMLLVFLALLALMNYLIGLPVVAYDAVMHTHHAAPSIEGILGILFWPLAFLMGVPIDDCTQVASLLGEKLVLTEFVAYMHLGEALTRGGELSNRATVIASYALCGFANFGSIGIQIGGISAMAPERRGDLARLGLRAMIGGTLAACMTACVAGMLV